MSAGQTPTSVTVESPSMQGGQSMPAEYTADGRNISPGLTWRGVPPGAPASEVWKAIQGQAVSLVESARG